MHTLIALMMKRSPITFFSLLLLLIVTLNGFGQTPASPKSETLTNKSVVELSKAGLSKSIIINKINTTPCRFDLSTTELVNLKKQGIAEDVLNAMMEKTMTNGQNTNGKNDVTKETTSLLDKANAPAGSGMLVPSTLNVIHSYDPATKKAVPLEKGLAQLKAKSTGIGSNSFFDLDGLKSTVRISGDKPIFIVNVGGATSDGFVLYKLVVKKASRQAALSSMSTFSGLKGSKAMIPVTMKLLQPGLYEITPDIKLEKGEYLFALKTAGSSLNSTTTDVYAFGVD